MMMSLIMMMIILKMRTCMGRTATTLTITLHYNWTLTLHRRTTQSERHTTTMTDSVSPNETDPFPTDIQTNHAIHMQATLRDIDFVHQRQRIITIESLTAFSSLLIHQHVNHLHHTSTNNSQQWPPSESSHRIHISICWLLSIVTVILLIQHESKS